MLFEGGKLGGTFFYRKYYTHYASDDEASHITHTRTSFPSSAGFVVVCVSTVTIEGCGCGVVFSRLGLDSWTTDSVWEQA